MAGEPGDVLALDLGALELEARGQQQLAARQPRRRVDDLGDVHPADGAVDACLTRHQTDVEIAQKIAQSKHRVTDRRPSYADSDKLADRRRPCQHGLASRRVTISYERTGSGPPLLLVHGLGSCKEMWRPLIPRLAREREVVAVDMPGFGASPTRAAHRRRAGRGAGRVRRRPRPGAAGGGGQLARRRRGAGDGREGRRELGLRRLARGLREPARGPVRPAPCWAATRVHGRAARPGGDRLARSAVLRTLLSAHVASRPWRIPPEDAAHWLRMYAQAPAFWELLEALDGWRAPVPACPTTIAWGEKRPPADLLASGAAGAARTPSGPARHAARLRARPDVGRPRPGSRGDSARGLRRAARSPRRRASAAASPGRRRRPA